MNVMFNNFKRIFLALILLTFSVAAFAANKETLCVSAAGNLSSIIPVINSEFEKKYPNIKVESIIGSSGSLANQIINGADVDVYMSANMSYPQKLYDSGLTTDKPEVYTEGVLVFFTMNPKISIKDGPSILTKKDIEVFGVANPTLAPYGKATLEYLSKMNLLDSVSNKIVYQDNLAQLFQQFVLGHVEVGFISFSLICGNEYEKYKVKDVYYYDIDPSLYNPIKQGIVIIKNTKNLKNAKLYYDFIFSDDVKKIFKEFGYK